MYNVVALVPLAIFLSPQAATTGAEHGHRLVDVHDSQVSIELPTAKQSSPHVSFVVTLASSDADSGGEVTLTVTGSIDPGWHIASLGDALDGAPSSPTQIEFQGSALTPVGDGFVSSPEPEPVEVGEVTHYQHSGQVTWTRKYSVAEGRVAKDGASDAALSGAGSIRFQVCTDEMCLRPSSLEFTLGQAAAPEAVRSSKRRYKTIGDPIRVALKESALERKLIDYSALVTADPQKDIDEYTQQLLKAMRTKEALPLGGAFTAGGDVIHVYLAAQDTYSLVNSTDDDTKFGNTATFLSIDHDGDEVILDHEPVPVNRPVRILDSMYLVTEIAKDDPAIVFQQIDTPLAGAVIGRRCPEFWYETVDGQVVSNKSVLGQVTILDVWAVI